ncbi:MAG: metal-dependent hydrolase [Phycisphaerae bacterium]
MASTITYLGHSGFLVSDGRCTVAVDPFLTGNPLAVHKPADIACQYVALTHGHDDHLGDAIPIAKRNGAPLVACWEICQFAGEQGCKTDPGNPGGRIATSFGWVAFTQAFHSSSHAGRYMGQPCGLMIHIGGVTVYHCGDTGLFGDMKLLGEIYQPRVACIPIGDRFTMGAELATRAAELIRPQVAIPIHYKTFPVLAQDARGFAPQGVEVREMKPGETWRCE